MYKNVKHRFHSTSYPNVETGQRSAVLQNARKFDFTRKWLFLIFFKKHICKSWRYLFPAFVLEQVKAFGLI